MKRNYFSKEDGSDRYSQRIQVTPEQFEQLANTKQLAKLELSKTGELIIMSPTGGEAGRKNRRLIQQVGN